MSPRVISIRIDLADGPGNAPEDAATRTAPVLWRGNAVALRLGLFDGAEPADLDGVTSLTLSVRAAQADPAVLAEVTTGTLTPMADTAAWEDGSEATATLTLTDAQTNLPVPGGRATYWAVVTALHATGTRTLAAGPIIWLEDNAVAAPPPPEWPGAGISLEQADARYANKDATSFALSLKLNASDMTEIMYAEETARNAAIVAEAEARESADSAMTSDIAALEARMGTAEDNINGLSSDIGVLVGRADDMETALATESAARGALDTAIAAVVDYETGAIRMWNTTLNAWVRMSCVGNPPQLELEILPS